MARFRKIARFINYLLISVFLMLTPFLGMALPARAENVSINLRMPWVSGQAQINGGNTYGCGDTHHNKDHYALDFQMSPGRPIAAVAAGTAHIAQEKDANGNLKGYGNYVWIQHANGYVSLYAHLESYVTSINNQQVSQGQLIGYAGGTGGVPVHLHFALRKNATNQTNGDAAEPIPMSRYSDFGNVPCEGTSQFYDADGPRPGGWWIGPTPSDGSKIFDGSILSTLKLNARVSDNSNGGLDRVELQVYNFDDGQGWRNIPVKTTPPSQPFGSGVTQTDAYGEYTVPWGTNVLARFNVYAKNGRSQIGANGTRQFCNNTVCSPWGTKPAPGEPGGGSSSGSGSGSGSQSSGCVPGQYQAAVFTDANFGGTCVVKGLGEYRTPEAIGLPNDSISSIKIGSGANVRLCDNSDLNSPCEYFSVDDPELNNNSINTNTVSSMKVEDTAPTTNCVPNQYQVAFFMNENYQETCILRGVGRYNDAGALGLPDNSISSVKVGARVWVRICDNVNNDSPCDQFEYDRPDLTPTTVQNNKASSAEVYLKGGIALCDNDLNDNNGGECRYFGAGDVGENLQNMSSHNFDNRIQSVRYDPDWEGRYHIVLYVDQNQTGALAHYDGTVAALQDPYRNNISSIKIYKNHPPNARALAPANGTVYPAATTSVTLNYTEGQEKRIHVWNNNGYDFTSDWAASETHTLTNLSPGTYSWQAQSRSPIIGEGAWSAVQTFSINTPPTVAGGNLTMEAGTSQSIQVQAFDAEQGTITMTTSGLPGFATFTDNGNGVGSLQLNPSTSQAGEYMITVMASDGQLSGSGTITLVVGGSSTGPTSSTFEDFEDGNTGWGSSAAGTNAESGNTYMRFSPPSGDSAESSRNTNAPVLAGYNAISVKINTHGANLLGNDASALYLDQNAGWKYVPLSNYVQQGVNGWQTVTIPLSDFAGFDKNQELDRLGFRFWVPSAATIDVDDILFLADVPEPPEPTGDYLAEYFNNRDLAGQPVLTRMENAVYNDWGGGSPHATVNIDNFSARWTKTTHFDEGTYTFNVTADDGVRLYIDDELVIDKWIDQGATTYTAVRALSDGNHTIVMEYYENGGGAVAMFDYDAGGSQSAPYTAEYFPNQYLQGTPVHVGEESEIDYDWGGGGPDPSFPVDHFSIRWSKTETFAAGNYRFTATGDDGVRLYIDGQLVIDRWIDQAATTVTADVNLAAGEHTIVYEYYENGGGAVVALSYQRN
jgi:murein DD-endopeptidase MepM/ murein hydrolase activator NlpD